MSKIEVNKIGPQCGTTLTVGCGAGQTVAVDANTVTIGRCGGTVALASGASQTGFGRTGTVDWQTTKKTADFTAANGEGYFVDTGSGAVIMTLPASPSAGNIVAVKDYDGNFGTAACTIARNGSNIRGDAANFNLNKTNAGVVLIYVDATEGWQIFANGNDNDVTNPFIVASGGTETTCGDCKIHTFTGPGTFTVTNAASSSANNIMSHLVVGGGAGGGARHGGGGGAGGFREVKNPVTPYAASPLDGYPSAPNRVTVTAQAYPITVGGAGSGQPGGCVSATKGGVSTFSTVTSAGGGIGAGIADNGPQPPNMDGGSGGGGVGYTNAANGDGNTPPTTPAQGFNGGQGYCNPHYSGGGGGGATAVGANATSSNGGNGGAGATTSITGSAVTRASGGSAGMRNSGGSQSGVPVPAAPGGGGAGGGSPGYPRPAADAKGGNGTDNTGGGGGGAARRSPNPVGLGVGESGAGGSGIVIIRYKFQ